MATSTSSSSSIQSRKLLLQTNFDDLPAAAPLPLQLGENNFDANVVLVLSVLLCAVFSSLALNYIIRCSLKFSSHQVSAHSSENRAASSANTGIEKKALKAFLTIDYTSDLILPGLGSECAICLSEFAPGERVRVLPICNHGFHVRCIDMWLGSHSSCPTCRRCLLETCQKVVDGTPASTSWPVPPPPQKTIVNIAPLDPEGFIRNYQN